MNTPGEAAKTLAQWAVLVGPDGRRVSLDTEAAQQMFATFSSKVEADLKELTERGGR